MSRRTGWVLGVVCLVAVAIVIVLLWPASDPLEDVRTVAVRFGSEGSTSGGIDVGDQLFVVLGDRNITIVSDEANADAVIEVTDLTVNLGDVEFSLTDAGLRGRASAICTLRDVRTDRTHVMDFRLEFDGERVTADLVPRKFWEFWKRKPQG